jgi:hypothetical protein
VAENKVIYCTDQPTTYLQSIYQTSRQKSEETSVNRKEGKRRPKKGKPESNQIMVGGAREAFLGFAFLLKTRPYLARAVLDDDVAVLADGSGLLGEGLGGAGIGLVLEGVLGIRHGRRVGFGARRGEERGSDPSRGSRRRSSSCGRISLLAMAEEESEKKKKKKKKTSVDRTENYKQRKGSVPSAPSDGVHRTAPGAPHTLTLSFFALWEVPLFFIASFLFCSVKKLCSDLVSANFTRSSSR